MASPDSAPGPLPLRLLPAALRARLAVPQLRRAPDDRPHEHQRGPPLPALRQLDAPTRLTMPPRDLFGERHVAPSILSADFARLGAQVEEVMAAGARAIHVHLMIDRPAEHVSEFAKAGADCITAHFEADPHIHRTLGAIHDAGCLAGVAINPGTPATAVGELDRHADLVLCMSVNPGWGGQSFI